MREKGVKKKDRLRERERERERKHEKDHMERDWAQESI